MTYTSRKHGAVLLSTELARGGEGAVYEVTGRPDLVAKIYHQPLSLERARKIETMATIQPVPYCAWPLDVVIDRCGQLRGFLMSRVSGRDEIHNLISPKERRQRFPNADYRFLVRTAANLARAIANVHEAGHVVGDINERFAMVGSSATVFLIDCDSFQISHDGMFFPCDMGTPAFQPPELQNVSSYRGLKRIRNDDCFGLAVHIFQLLFMGRHPFAGQPVSGEVLSLEEAIGQFLFAYDPNLQSRLRPPPHAMPLSSVTPRLQEYFRIAFGPRGARQGRPTAKAWAAALEEFAQKLQRCRVNPAHWHLPGECFICTVERGSGATLFVPSAGRPPDWTSSADELWRQIVELPRPRSWGDPPGLPAAVVPTGSRRSRVTGIAASVVVSLLFASPDLAAVWLSILGALALDYGRLRRRIGKARAAFDEAVKRYAGLRDVWRQHDPAERHDAMVRSLERCAHELRLLRDCKEKEIKLLYAQPYNMALKQYLDNIVIVPGEIPGIGAGLVATLRSFGIETAADCELSRLLRVPGVGRARAEKLIAWRKSKENAFRPSRVLGPDEREIARVEMEYASKAAPLVQELKKGFEILLKLHSISIKEKDDLLSQMGAAADEVQKAAARLRSVT